MNHLQQSDNKNKIDSKHSSNKESNKTLFCKINSDSIYIQENYSAFGQTFNNDFLLIEYIFGNYLYF